MNHGIGLPSSITDSSTEAIESVEIDRSSEEADHPITGGRTSNSSNYDVLRSPSFEPNAVNQDVE